MQSIEQSPPMHPFVEAEKKPVKPMGSFLLGIIIIFLGITTGYVLFARTGSTGSTGGLKGSSDAKQIVGRQDTKTFRDTAEGTLEANGVNGEGTHRLIRPGGESQTVYLTSSVVDLGEFVGKKVRVRGETFAAKKAAWLMDVGVVEVLE